MPTAGIPPAARRAIPLRQRLGLTLFRQARKARTKLHRLNFLFWECTLRCQLACRHCGSDCVRDAGVPDPPLALFAKALDELAREYPPSSVMLGLTGGEPLLRADLEDCGREFAQHGHPWGMVSNGYALTEARLESLLAAGLGSLTVSLDGLAASHDWLRGQAGSFDRAVAAIRTAAARPQLAFDVVTCVTRRNFGELTEIRDLLVKLGVRRWRIFNIFPKGRAAGNPELLLADAQFRELLDFIVSTRRAGRIALDYGCEGFLGQYENRARDGFFFCRAGIEIGGILADGSISACPSLRGDYIQGNLARDSILETWNTKYQVMRDRSWTRTGICAECRVYPWCEGNGLHLRDQQTASLLKCHYRMAGN